MLRRNWGERFPHWRLAISILVAIVICALVWVQYEKIHQLERGNAVANYKYERFIECVSLSPTRAAQCRTQAEQSGNDKSVEAYDLKAQQEMARWAALMLIITSVGIVYVALTLKAATEANQGFLTSAEKQLRAYLSVTPVDFKIVANLDKDFPQNIDVTFKVAIKNHGQTPAHNVKVWANITYDVIPIPDGFANRFAENLTHSDVINPGQTKHFTFDKSVSFYDRGIWETPPKSLILCGIVRYSAFGIQRCTRFTGHLSNMKEWWLNIRRGVVTDIEFVSAEHGNDAD